MGDADVDMILVKMKSMNDERITLHGEMDVDDLIIKLYITNTSTVSPQHVR